MGVEDLHEVQFTWPHPEANDVIVTGTFDEWTCSIHLTRTPTGFKGTTKMPWGEKIKFKFVVDGQWIVHEDQPTEIDPGGFVNNVYIAPPHHYNIEPPPHLHSEVAEVIIEEGELTNGHVANDHTLVAEGIEKPDSEFAEGRTEDDKSIKDPAKAEHPIDTQKITIPTPSIDRAFTPQLVSESVPPTGVDPASLVSPLAPTLPIMIVPVNAAENNTVSSSPPTAEVISPIPVRDAVGPVVIVTEPFATPSGPPEVKSEETLAPVSHVVESGPSLEVEQEKAIEVGTLSAVEDTQALPVLAEATSVGATVPPDPVSTSKESEAALTVTEPEPAPVAAEPVFTPVSTEPVVDSETIIAIPTIADAEAAVSTKSDVLPPATDTVTTTKQEPSPIASKPTAKSKATPAAIEPVSATTERTPIPKETTAAPGPEQITATTEGNVEAIPLFEVPKAKDAPAIVVDGPVADERVVEVKDVEVGVVEDAPLVEISPVVLNETPSPSPTPATDLVAAEPVKVTDTPIVVKEEEVGVNEGTPAVTEPLVKARVDGEPVGRLVVVPSGEFAPTSREPAFESALEPTLVVTADNDAPAVDEIKAAPVPEVIVVAAAGAPALSATNEPLATESSPVEKEVLSPKGKLSHTTTAGSAATTSTQEAPAVRKFPSSPALQPNSADSSPSSSKFNSTRKKRTSFFGKLKNIFDHDKVKEKK